MLNNQNYEYLLKKVIRNIKALHIFERFRHLVYKGKIKLKEFHKIQVEPDPTRDEVDEIAAYLGITPQIWSNWKKNYPDKKFPEYVEGRLSCNVDGVHDKGRNIVVVNSG